MTSRRTFVFDTNTLVSAALLEDSTPQRALRHALHMGTILLSADSLAELTEVTAREKLARYVTLSEREEFLEALVLRATIVDTTTVIATSRDPDDDKFLALSVVGVDSSAAMIERAPPLPDVEYRVASAERLPFEDAAFDLVTVALAFHWFDQHRFLQEAARVLRLGRWLVIYDNGFTGRMRERSTFETWMKREYWRRYPSPPRGSKEVGKGRAATSGFALEGQESYSNEVAMSREELVHYLLTQSNVISVVEGGEENAEDVAAWLERSVAPFFGDEPRTMIFGGSISYLRKQNAV